MKLRQRKQEASRLKSQKRKIESKCVIMDSEVTSCEMEEENNNTKSEAIIQCKNISSSNLSEEEIENILGNSRDSENCFDNNNNSDRNDENILKSEARTRKLKVRINKNLSKLIQNNKEEKKSKKIECKQKDKNESKEQNAKFEETSKKKKQDNTGKKETKKFFHHSEKPSLNARKKDNENLQIKEKRYSNIKKSSRKPLSVFDFSASQSSPSNSDDPTKDVINELVKKGKAQVVKYVKGSGKLKTKFRNPRPSKKQISKVESEPISAIPVSETRNMVKEVHFNINESIDSNFDDHHIDTASIPEVNKSNTNSFSGLARQAIQNRVTQSPYSTLMSNPRQIKDKNVLLALARSFIRRSEEMNKNKNISTKMNMPSNVKKLNASNQSGSASPWRVEEDLPSLFYFSRNSDNLPSASSDILYPPSPTRNKRKTSRISNKNLSLTKSLNNSNIENIQPSFEEPKLMIETNPKKGNPRRSPLKQIEIIDVINLPFMAKNNSTPIQKPAVFNPFSPLQIQTQKILFNESANDLENQTEEAEITNLFGFDQDIEEESMDNNDSAKLNTKISKNNLHHKLKKLKRLVPYKRPKQDQQGPTRLNIKKIRPIFEDTIETFHQPKIREMLCSTKNKSKENNEENEDSSNIVSSSDENGNENSREHYDLEPVLFETPTEANSVRTYRPKRKRTKLRNHFVLFHDSDEESDVELPKKKMKHHKNETNEKELTSFYQEFNTMCDEVDKYELVIQ